MLVELKETDVIRIDMMYAGESNMARINAYAAVGMGSRCFVHDGVAEALTRVEKTVQEMGLKLKICDAYRPPAAHQLLSARVPVAGLFAPTPDRSNHCRGTAVDVVLTDRSGTVLAFPTAVDAYTPAYAEQIAQGIIQPYFEHLKKASYAYPATGEEQKNREKLCRLMESAGFERLESEWWHFNFPVQAPLINWTDSDFV